MSNQATKAAPAFEAAVAFVLPYQRSSGIMLKLMAAEPELSIWKRGTR